jgi:hypothetical protein
VMELGPHPALQYSIINYRTFIFQPKIRSLGKGR